MISTVLRASLQDKQLVEARLDRLVECLQGERVPLSLDKQEFEYLIVAVGGMHAFGAVATAHHRKPAVDVYRTMLCCRDSGVSRPFNMAQAIDLAGSRLNPEGKRWALDNIKKTFVGMCDGTDDAGNPRKGYKLWNPAVLAGMAGEGEPWRFTTSVMAYNIDVWSMLEQNVEGWSGMPDIPARVTSRLHNARVCDRYDCLFPACLPLISLWVVAPSAIGLCGNPLCDSTLDEKEEEKEKARFPRCSGCQQISYCSVSCQRSDWNRHKHVCVLCRIGGVTAAKLM